MIALVPGLNRCGLGVPLAARAEPAAVSGGGPRAESGVAAADALLDGVTVFLVVRRLRAPPMDPVERGVRGVLGGMLRGTRVACAAFPACTWLLRQKGRDNGRRGGRE